MQTPSNFYNELLASDWLGRTSADYTHKKSGSQMGWESSLTNGSAYSSYVIPVNSDEKSIASERKIIMAKQLCNSIVSRMAPVGKSVKVSFTTDIQSYRQGDKIMVSLEPLGSAIPFPSLNHRFDPIAGFAVHEMLHILHTDKSYDKYIERFTGPERQLKRELMNLIEDERIEKKAANSFSGYLNYIGKTKDYVFGALWQEELKNMKKKEAEDIATGKVKEGSKAKEVVTELFESLLYMIRYPVSLREEMVNKHEKSLRAMQQILTPYPETIQEMTVCCDKIYEIFRQAAGLAKSEPATEKSDTSNPQNTKNGKAQTADGAVAATNNTRTSNAEDGTEHSSGSSEQNTNENKSTGSDGSEGASDVSDDQGNNELYPPKDGAETSRQEPDDSGEQSGGSDNDLNNADTGINEGSDADTASGDEADSGNTAGDESGEDNDESSEGGDVADESDDDTAGSILVVTPDELAEMLSDILTAIEKATPLVGNSKEVAKKAKMSGYTSVEIITTVSNMDAGDIENLQSKTHSFPETANLHPNEMTVKWIPSKELTGKNNYNQALTEVSAYASSLRAHLMKLNRSHEYTQTGLSEGKFDINRLVPALIGSKNVYQQTTKVSNRGATIAYLADESGSMAAGKNWWNAMKIGVLFERVLDNLNSIDYHAYGHTTNSGYGSDLIESTVIHVYYEGRKRGIRQDIGKISNHNGNRDGHALLEVACRVRSQMPKDQPLIIFMASDGEPSSSVPHGFTGKSYVKHVVEVLEKKMNTTVIHIAITEGIPSHLMFNHYVTLTDFNTLIRDIGALLVKLVAKAQAPIEITL